MILLQNPPFKGNLHLRILNEGMKHSKEVIHLGPTTFLQKQFVGRKLGQWRKTLNGRVDKVIDYNKEEIQQFFGIGNQIRTMGILRVKKHSDFDLLNYEFSSSAERSLFEKMSFNNKDDIVSFSICRCKLGRLKCLMSDKENFRQENDLPVYTWHEGANIKDSVLSTKEDPKMVLYFDSKEERQRFIDSLDTKFMRWYFKEIVKRYDYNMIDSMFRLKKYDHKITNEDFYEIFNLNEDERKIINDSCY